VRSAFVMTVFLALFFKSLLDFTKSPLRGKKQLCLFFRFGWYLMEASHWENRLAVFPSTHSFPKANRFSSFRVVLIFHKKKLSFKDISQNIGHQIDFGDSFFSLLGSR